MSPRRFIPQKKISLLLLTIALSTALLLVACVELPSPSPIKPTEPATTKETPATPQTPTTPIQPPVKPQEPTSPVPQPSPPMPTPLPSPPPTEEKTPSNGIVEPQSLSTTTNGGGNKIFLSVDGIPGESTDAEHDEWIDVLSFSHGVSQPSGISSVTRSAERCEHEDFIITKELDKSSPKLALACCKGEHIIEVVIEVCRADTTGKYMQYTLTDVIVTSISQNGASQGEDAKPIEEVSFSYGRIDWSYTETDYMTGKPKGNVEAYWNIETNKGG